MASGSGLFTDEELEKLKKAYPDILQSRSLPVTEVKDALNSLGAGVAGHEVRDLIGDASKKSITIDELAALFATATDMKDTSKELKKNTNLKVAQEVFSTESKRTDADAKHSVSLAEERGFTSWINNSLEKDQDCKNAKLIPINATQSGDLYEKCINGVVLCKLINVAAPNTIDERSINKGDKLKLIFNRNENLTLAVNSAAAIGCCVVNIGPEDIANETRHIVLGLIWQLIRKCLVDSITLANHTKLLSLLREGEDPETLKKLRPEELLLRWVNYHLEQAGINRRMSNFTEDIHDSEIYSHLMNQIAPADKKMRMHNPDPILSETSLQKRAGLVLENADQLGAGHLLTAEDIYLANEGKNKRDRLNLAFVATLFNNYPGLTTPTEEVEIEQETLEEKAYRNWFNSLGVSPFVSNLYTDLANAVPLLELIDRIRPGIVDWKRVVRKFDAKRIIFQEQENCNLAIEYSRILGIKIVNLSGEDIRNCEKKLILGLLFQLMRTYTFELLKEASGGSDKMSCDDKEVLQWTNEKLESAGEQPLTSFRDARLSTGLPLVAVLESLGANVDRAQLSANTTDNLKNCTYAISLARKAGARIYALPEHLHDLNGKMILTIFLCLMVLMYRRPVSTTEAAES